MNRKAEKIRIILTLDFIDYDLDSFGNNKLICKLSHEYGCFKQIYCKANRISSSVIWFINDLLDKKIKRNYHMHVMKFIFNRRCQYYVNNIIDQYMTDLKFLKYVHNLGHKLDRGRYLVRAGVFPNIDCMKFLVKCRKKVKSNIPQRIDDVIGDLFSREDHKMECLAYIIQEYPSIISDTLRRCAFYRTISDCKCNDDIQKCKLIKMLEWEKLKPEYVQFIFDFDFAIIYKKTSHKKICAHILKNYKVYKYNY